MFPSDKVTETKISITDTDSTTLTCPAESRTGTTVATAVRDSTKDTGRVHIGGGMMRF